jgi:hypothetical protein
VYKNYPNAEYPFRVEDGEGIKIVSATNRVRFLLTPTGWECEKLSPEGEIARESCTVSRAARESNLTEEVLRWTEWGLGTERVPTVVSETVGTDSSPWFVESVRSRIARELAEAKQA